MSRVDMAGRPLADNEDGAAPAAADRMHAEAELCRRKAEDTRRLAEQAVTRDAKAALETISANWAELALHLERSELRKRG
jgi:hypothetical protein